MKSLNQFNKIRCKVMPIDPNSQKENRFSKIIPSDSLQPNYKGDIVHLILMPLILPIVLLANSK